MPFDWIIPTPGDEYRNTVHFNGIGSQNDGDAVIACITHEIITDASECACIDVGADMAWWSLFCKYYNPSSHIHAFEPHPTQYQLLEKHSGPRFTTYNAAVSDTNSTILMEFNDSCSHSRTHTGTPVKTTHLDVALNLHNSINIIKIDTEGHEYTILMSLKDHLHKIQSIVFEFTTYWYGNDKSECITKSKEMLDLISTHYPFIYLVTRRFSLKLIRITEENFIPVILSLYNKHLQTDVFCSKKEITSLDIIEEDEFLENAYIIL
jgi:FkbM family methyltransferase